MARPGAAAPATSRQSMRLADLTRIARGAVRPSAFAVFKSIIISNLSGCPTGRSATENRETSLSHLLPADAEGAGATGDEAAVARVLAPLSAGTQSVRTQIGDFAAQRLAYALPTDAWPLPSRTTTHGSAIAPASRPTTVTVNAFIAAQSRPLTALARLRLPC